MYFFYLKINIPSIYYELQLNRNIRNTTSGIADELLFMILSSTNNI